MSVIAWDGHVLAADKQATNNGLKRTTTKIHRVGECLVAFTGDASQGMLMVEWLRGGCVPDEFPASQRDKDDWAPVAVIRPDRTIATYERTPVPVVIEDRIYAAGCGRDYAMAVMHLGLGAVKAVEVACALDAYCGNGMDTLSLEA
jgi:ATP-dependent protease HslVU (ClpYQ) peptidase subunit